MVRRYMDSFVPDEEITGGQCRTLGFIKKRTEQGIDTYQRDIEKEFNIRRSSVTSLLQLLERKGLIERQSVDEDARLKKLIITPLGYETDKKVMDGIYESEEHLRSALTEEEQETLRCLMDKIKKSVEEDNIC
ncbi:MAG: MarR family transcriptional regulator [Lachnospiraceae bacterium]|nr:MarR family transcriptional regulator [Lachnospiraceae bacterium]